MLNGVAPILIYNFGTLPASITSAIGGIPLIGGLVGPDTQIPIPVYLDERATGVLVDSESKNIGIETVIQPTITGKAPNFSQRVVTSSVTIGLVGSRDSLVLMAILAFSEKLIPLITARKYSITYLNGATTVFGALLSNFSVTPIDNTDKLSISMTLENTSKKDTKNPTTAEPVAEVYGPTPALVQ